MTQSSDLLKLAEAWAKKSEDLGQAISSDFGVHEAMAEVREAKSAFIAAIPLEVTATEE